MASNRTHINSETGHLALDDDDEDDEMALYSPEKPPQPAKASTSSSTASRVKTHKASSKSSAKKILGVTESINRERPILRDDSDGEQHRLHASPPKTKTNKTATNRKAKPPTASRKVPKARRPAALIESSDDDVDPQSSVCLPPRSAQGVSMSEEQIETFLQSYDLEATHRRQRMCDHLDVAVDAARLQMETIISSWPAAARAMTTREFIETYAASIEDVTRAHAALAGDNGRSEWEDMKKKRQREREEDAEQQQQQSKAAKAAPRTKRAAAPAPSTSKNVTASSSRAASTSSTAASRARTRSAATTRTTKISATSVNAVAVPPLPSSGPVAPSSSTFSPQIQLPSRPATPKKSGRPSRLPKAGEVVRYYSVNGSPITGIVESDGRIRFVEGDEEAAELTRPNAAAATHAIPGPSKTTSKATANTSRAQPASPAPKRNSGYAYSASSTPIVFDDEARKATALSSDALDDSGELPDEAAYMRQIMAEETARREAAAAAVSAAAALAHTQAQAVGPSRPPQQHARSSTNGGSDPSRPSSSGGGSRLLGQSKSSFSRLRGALQHHNGRSEASSSSAIPGPSSPLRASSHVHPPSSPSRQMSVSGGKSGIPTTTASSSSPSRGMSLRLNSQSPTRQQQRSPTGKGTASGAPTQRLSFFNTRGEAIDLAQVREEDIPSDQKASLWSRFGRLGLGGGGSSNPSPSSQKRR